MVQHQGKDFWSLPGGHIEEGENIYKALKREIFEELQLKIKILGNTTGIDIEGIKEKPQPLCVYKIKFCTLREKEVKKLEYIFHSKIKSGEIQIQEEEIAHYDFFTKEQIINEIKTYEQVKALASKL